jgi:replicative DNA helicase
MHNLQTTILQKLVTDEQYLRKVLPFIKEEYFTGEHRLVYKMVLDFVSKYNKLPTATTLDIDLGKTEVTEEQYPKVMEIIGTIDQAPEVDGQWLVENTEKWCQDRAIFLGVMEAFTIIEGKSKDKTTGAIPDILSKALAVTFDTNVGHDYLNDSDDRFDFYHRTEERIPFALEKMNLITKGGVPRKTLNIVMAGTGVGKTIFLCDMSATYLTQGKNVLYITMEMAEERIAERIDANLMNVDISQIENMSKDMYSDKVSKIAAKTNGKLIIKEYPTGAAHAGHFRALLNELKLKKNFAPDVIMIDYLNICASSRLKGLGNSINTNTLVKTIAEEIRGLAKEFNVPIWSATQTNRTGYSNTDVDITEVAESWGLPQTADLMIALISTEDLDKIGQLMVKQLKNRYNDVTKNKRFVIGVDRSKMKLFDVDEKAQNLIAEPVEKPSGLGGLQFKGGKLGNTSDFKV